VRIVLLRRKTKCFSKAILTTDLNTLSLLLQRAKDDAELDLSKSSIGEQHKAHVAKELDGYKSLLAQLDDEDLFADGQRTVIELPK
jgi:hypothetical protein